jgi:hypothetical protein
MGCSPNPEEPARPGRFCVQTAMDDHFLGGSEFFLALRFLETGLFGTYVAFIGGLTAGIFLFFPDAAYFLGKWFLSLKSKTTR